MSRSFMRVAGLARLLVVTSACGWLVGGQTVVQAQDAGVADASAPDAALTNGTVTPPAGGVTVPLVRAASGAEASATPASCACTTVCPPTSHPHADVTTKRRAKPATRMNDRLTLPPPHPMRTRPYP